MIKNPKTGKFPYKSLSDCMRKSIKNEGFTKLWVGFPTFTYRVAPHAMIVTPLIYLMMIFKDAFDNQLPG